MSRSRSPCAHLLPLLASALLLTQTPVPTVFAQPDDPTPQTYVIRTWVIGAAGAPGTSATHRINGTLCQPTPIGVGAGNDLTLYAGFWTCWLQGTVSVVPLPTAPFVTALLGSVPNPFSAATTVRFSLAREAPVEIRIFDVAGRSIRTLTSSRAAPGLHQVSWDARNDAGVRTPSGTYFCRLTSDSYASVRKLLLVR